MSATSRRGKDLSALMKKVASESEAPETPEAPQPEPKPSSTQGLSALVIFVTDQDKKRLKDLSYHTGESLQKLGIEAWSMLLEKRGHARLTPATANKPSGRRG